MLDNISTSMKMVAALILLVAVFVGLVKFMPHKQDPVVACHSVVDAVCSKAIECGDVDTDVECREALGGAGAFCQPDALKATVEQMSTCAEDIQAMTCQDALPDSCQEL